MTNNQLTDLRSLILCEISDFFAGFGCPGEPESPEEIQRELTMRVGSILNAHIVNYPRCEVLVETLKECRIARDEAQAELQDRRKAAIEPIYQYRIRNGYNGQVTEWQTIRRDQVDFVLKAQPHNAGFQIITAPPAPDDGREQFEAWMLKKWGRERQEYDFVMGKFLHGDNYADSYTRHMWKAWTASRAAMINGNKHAQ